MRGDNAECLLLVETFQNGLAIAPPIWGSRTAAKLIDKDKAAFVTALHHYLHVRKMRRVGAQVFDRLLVTDVNEYIAEYTGVTAFMHRDEQAALQHMY